MEKEIWLDTLQQPDIKNRIEYRLLETQRKLRESNVLYNRWSYLPAVSANGAYNLNFQNDQFSKLYSNNFPNSFAGISLALPLFQGGKRKADIHTATLELHRTDKYIVNFENAVNAQYSQALATYKSSLQNYLAQQENVALAKEVYDVIQLQYRSGIKTYLEVITAETDLRTAQINYYNTLYQVLAGKIDVQRALGQIIY
jgi:outer membrane protein TolC